MRIDKRKIDMLCSMSDERLWGALKFFASSLGADLSKKRVRAGDMERVRRTLSSLTDGDIARINDLVSVWKYGR